MKEYLIDTVNGEVDHIVGQMMLDPINNTLVVDYKDGGCRSYYLPNVIAWSEQDYDDDDE